MIRKILKVIGVLLATIFLAFIVVVAVIWHNFATYYIKNDDGGAAKGGYTFWKEYKKTTFHGICAEVYGSNDKWLTIRTYGVNKDGGSASDDETISKTMEEAYRLAEEHCPTSSKK